MTKISTIKKTANVPISKTSSANAANDAKMLFATSTLGMSWQLALTVLIPIFFGSWLDGRYHKQPLWTIVGLIVALLCSFAVVRKTVAEVNRKQSEDDNL